MKRSILFAFTLCAFIIEPAWAACGPPMCPYEPAPTDPLRPPSMRPPNPHRPRLFIGYFEVASPNCTEEDFKRAVIGSKADALRSAQVQLNTPHVIQVTDFRLSVDCKQSIYAGSFRGNSWIVQAFVKYKR